MHDFVHDCANILDPFSDEIFICFTLHIILCSNQPNPVNSGVRIYHEIEGRFVPSFLLLGLMSSFVRHLVSLALNEA